MKDYTYEKVCAAILLRLDDWMTAKQAGASRGQMMSLKAAGLVHSSPDFRNPTAQFPLVYRRTKAGDRAAVLLRAVTTGEENR